MLLDKVIGILTFLKSRFDLEDFWQFDPVVIWDDSCYHISLSMSFQTMDYFITVYFHPHSIETKL